MNERRVESDAVQSATSDQRPATVLISGEREGAARLMRINGER